MLYTEKKEKMIRREERPLYIGRNFFETGRADIVLCIL